MSGSDQDVQEIIEQEIFEEYGKGLDKIFYISLLFPTIFEL